MIYRDSKGPRHFRIIGTMQTIFKTHTHTKLKGEGYGKYQVLCLFIKLLYKGKEKAVGCRD